MTSGPGKGGQRGILRGAGEATILRTLAVKNPGTSLTHNSLQRTFDLKSVHTAGNYLHYLEEAYLIFCST